MSLVVQSFLLLVHQEALVGVDVEEHYEEVAVISVSTVILITATVAFEQHSLSAESPVRLEVDISAVGEVVRLLLARCIDKCDVVVVITSVAVV